MNKSESIGNLAKALATAQGEMKAAEMTATNPFLKNRYADLGAVIVAIKPVLSKNGLSVVQPVSGTGEFVTVTTLLMHESGEWIEEIISLPVGEARGKSQAQEAGSIITYLRRYSLASMLGVYADEDTDGNPVTQNNGKTKAELPNTPPAAVAEPVTKEPESKIDWLPEALMRLSKEYSQPMNRIANALAYSNLEKPSNYDEMAAWMSAYRANRDNGLTPAEAGKAANKEASNV